MADEPVTLAALTKALVDFHRYVIRPDIQRIVQDAVESSERRTSHQMDGLAHKLTNLEDEVKTGFAQNTEQFQSVTGRLDKLATGMAAVDGRLDRLESRLETT